MASADARLRIKVYAILTTLVALWAYAAFLTARDAVDLLQVRTLSETLGQPTDSLILGLQAERRLSVVVLGRPGQPRTALTAQRARTDEAVAALRRFANDTDVRLAGAGVVQQRAAAMTAHLDAIGPLREAVDAGRLDQGQASANYAEIIDAGFAVYGSQWTSRETELIEDTRALVALARASEVLAREDSLVAGALAAGRWTEADRTRLTELVATGRFVRSEAATGLPDAERARYDALAGGQVFAGLHSLEQKLIEHDLDSSVEPPIIKPQAWQPAVESALAALRELVASGVRNSVERATPSAVGVIVRTGLVGGLGLVAVVGAILISVTTTKTMARRLGRLRVIAERVSEQELPDIAGRLRRGEPVEALIATTRTHGADPIGQLGQAIETVRRTAVRAVAAEATAHQGMQHLFLHLTRRNQVLLRRQFTLIEAIERREADAAELADLFRVDHLATRIRRNVEKLITMAGATPGRRWRRPVPLLDVVRGAVAEVEDYPRVLVSPDWTGAVAGPAVTDLVHLLAELIENGLSFAPQSTTVRVSGERYDNGWAIVINDDGPGMALEELAAANELVQHPPEGGPVSGPGGLYVVGQLAQRHGVTVELRTSPRRGTTAVVLIPATLIVDNGTIGPSERRATPGAPTAPAVLQGHLADDRVGGWTAAGQPIGATPAAGKPNAAAPAAGQPNAATSAAGKPTGATPAGLPMRPRRSGPDSPAQEDETTPRSARTGQPPDGSETVEIPVTRSAPDQPSPGTSGVPAYAHRVNADPRWIDRGFNSTERTASGSPHGHDR